MGDVTKKAIIKIIKKRRPESFQVTKNILFIQALIEIKKAIRNKQTTK